MPAREHIPFFYVISGIYADKARLKTSLWVSARPISLKNVCGFYARTHLSRESLQRTEKEKCREKTHRQWASLLGRKLFRRRSTSLQWRWFHAIVIIILLLNDFGTLPFSLLLRSNGYRQTSSFGNKGFLFFCLQLSTPKAQQPSPCFLWVNYPMICLQQCVPHYSPVNVKHRFVKLLQTNFTIFSPK